MITITALKSPRYLAALKTAALQAVRLAHSRVCPAAACWVKNRRGEASIYAQFCRGRSVEFFDTNGRNVTELVLGALREWHAMKRAKAAAKILDYPCLKIGANWNFVSLRMVDFRPSGPTIVDLIERGWLSNPRGSIH